MARLMEYQGKAALAGHGIAVPRGSPAATPEQAREAARALGGRVVVKIQSWTTGRAAIGGIAFADTPDQAAEHAKRMLAMTVGQFPITTVLVEERIEIAKELFVSVAIDDRARAPIMLFSAAGGSGIEERADKTVTIGCDVAKGPDSAALTGAVRSAGMSAGESEKVAAAVRVVFATAKAIEARSLEINPLVMTRDGRVLAADCRVTVDDYAVFRHPELGIEIAREFDHPPTALERLAYDVEQSDHRGTFYFAQLNTAATAGSRGLVGFHGAGGGGSMMAMDAITAEGFTIADFTDTSGNPSAAKVYRAARIILMQPGLVGYFGSGSGVASQEQFWSAYGLAKAFWEMNLDIPAVIRLGGNTEDRAVEILQAGCKGLPAAVEGYRKSDPPAKIAARFSALVSTAAAKTGGRALEWTPRPPRKPTFVNTPGAAVFDVSGGRVWIDAARWGEMGRAVVARSGGVLRDVGGKPGPTVSPEEMMNKDSEMIACEVECRRDGVGGAEGAVFVELDLPGRAPLFQRSKGAAH